MERLCLTVQLEREDLIEACRKAALAAAQIWREDLLPENQIKHVLEHSFPGIPPRFLEPSDLEKIGIEAASLLGIRLMQVDGIGLNG